MFFLWLPSGEMAVARVQGVSEMKKRAEKDLGKLARAAFREAAKTVVDRAIASGTPVILWINGEVCEVDPKTIQLGRKRRPNRRRKAKSRGTK